MKHRFLFFMTALIMSLSTLFLPMQAAADDFSTTEIVKFEDGSYLEIITEQIDMRTSYTKSGSKTYNFRNKNNEIEWKAVHSASFTYTGSSATCTSASCTVTTYSNDWYVVSKSTTRSGNTSTTQLTMGEKVLGVTISKPSYTITLSCDANGNLS